MVRPRCRGRLVWCHMSESGLSIGAPELRAEIGVFLGYGRAAPVWTVAQLAEINALLDSGVRRVYYPPAVAQGGPHEWSWLRPTTTLTLVVGDGDYDLPDDFGRLVGCFHYAPAEHRASAQVVSVAKILQLRSSSDQSGAPCCAAVRYKASDGTDGQRQEVLFWPEPDVAYVLSYEYEAYSGPLTDASPYPLGGMQYAELYIESCLAVAESRMNDELGQHNQQFQALLVDAIGRDRKHGPQVYGPMGHAEPQGAELRRGWIGDTYQILYKGVAL